MPECSVYEYMYWNNEKYPSDIALNYFGNKISYGELFENIDKAAKAFNALGVKPEEIVTIVSISTVSSIVCFYALNRIGAVSDFVNVLSETDELRFYFEEAKSRTVVTLDMFGEKVVKAAEGSNVEHIVTFSVDDYMPVSAKMGYKLQSRGADKKWQKSGKIILWNDFMKLAKDKPAITFKKDAGKMALLAHTGGTTGIPKAVMISDFTMNYIADYYTHCFTYTRGQVWGNVMIPFVIYGILTCMHMPLSLGLTIAVIPKFDVREWKQYIKKYHFNYVLGVPSYVNPLVDDKRQEDIDLSGLYVCGVGGDGMNNEMEEKINRFFRDHGADIEIQKGYGLSEIGSTAVTTLNGINKIGSVGIPLIHNNIMIYNCETGRELKYGETGEICLQCPSRMIGYLDNEEATKDLFWKHEDGNEWLHTGDLGYVDEDGFLFLVGRMKRIILTTGGGVAYKVFPNMIESILDEHKATLQSCVVGAIDNENQVLRAFCMVGNGTLEKTDEIECELRHSCEEKLPKHARPRFYEFCTQLPLTTVGKVDYRALEKKSAELNEN